MKRQFIALVGVLLLAPWPAAGQEEVDAVLEGRLLLAGVPQDSGTVVLHRVTPSESGAVDSTRVDAEGRFSFRLPNLPVPGSGEVFFATARYEGILYFGAPVTEPVQLDSLYEVRAYPSREASGEGLPFPLSLRNVLIEEGPMGWRVTDFLEIRNDSAVTFVPEEPGRPVWSYPLPAEARSPRVARDELAPTSVRFLDDERMIVIEPVPPGERLYVIQYDLETIEFDLPAPGETDFLQVLFREPAPEVRMEGLTPQGPVEIEVGSSYLAWAGAEIRDRTVRVRRGAEGDSPAVVWVAVGLAILLALAGTWALWRTPAPAAGRAGTRGSDGPFRSDAPSAPGGIGPAAGGAGGRPRREILLEIARLDEEHEARELPDEEERDYLRRRAALIRELEKGGGSPNAGSGPDGP